MGGRGFRYFGGHEYQWDIGGSSSMSPFEVRIVAPDKIHILSPAAGELLSRSGNMLVKWRGGGEKVTLLISALQEGASLKPLFRLQMRRNKGRLLIPKRILQLLPEDRSRFLFTFCSESSSTVRLETLYSEEITVKAITSHSLVYYLNR